MKEEDGSPSEKRVFHSRLLLTKEARTLYDMRSVSEDLAFCKSNFLDIREDGVVECYIAPIFSFEKRRRDNLAKVVTALIYYRRCFKSGVRSPLSSKVMKNILNVSEFNFHNKLIDIADKHIAHSVNDLEMGAVTVQVATRKDGSLVRGGLSSGGAGSAPLCIDEVCKAIEMIDKILNEVLNRHIQTLEHLVQAQIDAMSDEQLLALPDGFVPLISRNEPGARRKWPPRGDR